MRIRKMMVISAALLLTACGNEAMEVERSANGSKSELIATIRGCEVWYVSIGFGGSVYTTICPNGRAETSRRISCGKNCTKEVNVTTEFE